MEEVVDCILRAIAYSCLLATDLEKYKKICFPDREPDEDVIEEAKKIIEASNQLKEQFNLFFDSSGDGDTESLERTFKRFNSNMIRIHGEIRNAIEDDGLTEEDIEEYYNQTQKAVKTLKKRISVAINEINVEIEDAYED